jgi:hypothetical protein
MPLTVGTVVVRLVYQHDLEGGPSKEVEFELLRNGEVQCSYRGVMREIPSVVNLSATYAVGDTVGVRVRNMVDTTDVLITHQAVSLREI